MHCRLYLAPKYDTVRLVPKFWNRVNNLNCYSTIISSDANLIDANGDSIEVDFSVTLPVLHGQPAKFTIGIPNSVMQVPDLKTPWGINTLQCSEKVTLKGVYYRSIIKNDFMNRKFGSTPVQLSHVESLTVEMDFISSTSSFLIYLSDIVFFETMWVEPEHDRMSEIVTFSHPELGLITLKKYSVEARLLDSNGSLKLNGYLLEIQCIDNLEHNSVIEHIQPLLNIISLLARQRVLICGWDKQSKSKYTRHWKYPLETTQTKYSLPKPEKYLVTSDELEATVNLGLKNYYALEKSKQDIVHKLSFNLCSAIERRDEVKYMALFTNLESLAKDLMPEQELDNISSKVIELIKTVAIPQKTTNHSVFTKLMDLTSHVKKSKTAADAIDSLLSKYRVKSQDLWSIRGNNGLLNIRNHLAHTGNHGINHQGLFVATFHLTILIERLVLSMLDLTLVEFNREPWLKLDYFETLKNEIIQK